MLRPGSEPKAGQFRVEDLKWGDYTLVETKAPAGYELDETERPFTISRDRLDFAFEEPIVNKQAESPQRRSPAASERPATSSAERLCSSPVRRPPPGGTDVERRGGADTPSIPLATTRPSTPEFTESTERNNHE